MNRRNFFTKMLGGLAAVVMASPVAKALCAKRTPVQKIARIERPELAWKGALLQITRMEEEESGNVHIRARRVERLADDPRHIALVLPDNISSFSIGHGCALWGLEFSLSRYKALGMDAGDLIQILKKEPRVTVHRGHMTSYELPRQAVRFE